MVENSFWSRWYEMKWKERKKAKGKEEINGRIELDARYSRIFHWLWMTVNRKISCRLARKHFYIYSNLFCIFLMVGRVYRDFNIITFSIMKIIKKIWSCKQVQWFFCRFRFCFWFLFIRHQLYHQNILKIIKFHFIGLSSGRI